MKLASITLALLAPIAFAQPDYTVQTIPVPGGTYAQAWGVNIHAVVVGEYENPGTLPFRWDAVNGSITLPQLPGHTGGGAYSINEQGQIAGWAWDGAKRQAVIWNDPTLPPAPLGWSGSTGAAATALNDLGAVVGDDGAGHAYRYVPGAGLTPLAPLPGLFFANALAINNFGEVAGVSFSDFFGGAPIEPAPTTIWSTTGARSCPPCTAADPNLCETRPRPGQGCVLSFGATINDNGVLCMSTGAGLAIEADGTVILQAGVAAAGASSSGTIAIAAVSSQSGAPIRAFVAKNGALTELPTAGLDTTYPHAISANGILAGQGAHTGGPKNSTALVWLPSSFTCPGDVNGDERVDLSDIGILLSHYGDGGALYSQGDLTGDGTVDLSDLGLMLAQYGATCP